MWHSAKLRLMRWKLERAKARAFRRHMLFMRMPNRGDESYAAVLEFEATKRKLEALELGTLRYRLSRYGLPEPIGDDAWEIRSDGLRIFSRKGAHESRVAIRKELNERWKAGELRFRTARVLFSLSSGKVA